MVFYRVTKPESLAKQAEPIEARGHTDAKCLAAAYLARAIDQVDVTEADPREVMRAQLSEDGLPEWIENYISSGSLTRAQRLLYECLIKGERELYYLHTTAQLDHDRLCAGRHAADPIVLIVEALDQDEEAWITACQLATLRSLSGWQEELVCVLPWP
jgi:hypothetical protein